MSVPSRPLLAAAALALTLALTGCGADEPADTAKDDSTPTGSPEGTTVEVVGTWGSQEASSRTWTSPRTAGSPGRTAATG